MRVALAETASDEIDAIHAFLMLRNPLAAHRVVERILDCTMMLADHPLGGRESPDGRGRMLPVAGLPYTLRYVVLDECILVTHVLHGARLWPPRHAHDEDE